MEQPNSKFPTMGTSAANGVKTSKPLKGKLVKKVGNIKGATDPYVQPKPARTIIRGTSAKQYGITAKMPSYVDPQIGPTQGNGRMVRSAINRTAPNFVDGISDHN